MARVTYGSMVTELRGKIGGTVFQRNAYGFSAKNKGTTCFSATAFQQSMRDSLKKAVQAWSLLSSGQRDSWNVYASTYPQYPHNGGSTELSGYNVFVKSNALRFMASQGIVTNCVLANNVENTFNPEAQVASGEMAFNLGSLDGSNNSFFLIFLSPPIGYYTSITKKNTRYIILTSDPEHHFFMHDEYIAVYGALPSVIDNLNCKVLQVGIDNGQVSAYSYFRIVIT